MKNKDLEYLKNFFGPYTNRVYLVGGCVRDEILGKSIKEYDLEVYDIDPETFDKLMKKLGAKGVGKSFFVYKWKNFDIALPRIESKIAKGHRGFKVSITQDEKEASKRRDFTINAIGYDVKNKQILDPYHGRADLEKKLLNGIN